ncbi:MAG: transposase [Roseiarcus sp.]
MRELDASEAGGASAEGRSAVLNDKARLAVDQESGLVRQAEMTSADLHDGQGGEAMIQGEDGEAYYADNAYDSLARCEKLNELGMASRTRSLTRSTATAGRSTGKSGSTIMCDWER